MGRFLLIHSLLTKNSEAKYPRTSLNMPKTNAFWIVKQKPSKITWDIFLKEGQALWDGVRNYQARNNLKAMKKGDLVFFYQSRTGKEILGITRVIKEAYPDPTTDDPNWVAVDLKTVKSLNKPVNLEDIKAHKDLQGLALLRQSRLSVIPVTKKESDVLLKIGQTTL